MKYIYLLIFALGFGMTLNAQATLSGKITDAEEGEELIGANILIGSKGTITDINGDYTLQIDPGTYTIQVSYVGYDPIEEQIEITGDMVKNFEMGNVVLKEIEVVADIAQTRETPVAFSNVSVKQLTEELASQDLPMVLNSTPGAYATQSGGGDGDARITIRGFNQRNVAVMLDGIPVNDMENGWVYWSNWFGLDLATKTMQVQRGLGASKLAQPSVGGTINILTKGIDSKRQFGFKQEVGNDGYLRSTLSATSGQLEKGWGISAALSYKRGNGWVDETWTEGVFYYLRIDKQIGNHLLTLSGFGAPQSHGQRSFANAIEVYDRQKALDVGIPESELLPQEETDRGLRYNRFWGSLNGETLNTRKNYYHKPQISLRHSWSVNEKLYISNNVYLSIGNGGGTGTFGTSPNTDSTGQLDLQAVYDANQSTNIFKPEPYSEGILRSSINNHFWYGILSTAEYQMNDRWTFSGGVDARSYTGQHYREVYDLLGGDYFKNIEVNDRRNKRIDELNTQLNVGDRIYYDYNGYVKWGGLFGLAEYSDKRFSAFFNASSSLTAYAAEDFMWEQFVELPDTSFYVNYYSPTDPALNTAPTVIDNVVYTINGPVGDDLRNFAETNGYSIDSTSAKNQRVDFVVIPSVSIKTGVAYKINKQHSVFFNTGYLSRATRFDNVINNFYSSGRGRLQEFKTYENEKVYSVEAGYNFRSSKFSANVNGYYTLWANKPLDRNPTVLAPGEDPSDPEAERIQLNISGISARHVGLELDFAYKINRQLTFEGLASVADWTWQGSASAIQPDGSEFSFDATGVHVGDAAQLQFGGMLRYEPIDRLYFKVRGTFFGKQFANFQPEDLQGADARRESWQLPNYFMMNAHAGYGWKVKGLKMDLRLNVLNALNTTYISDARNNDQFVNSTQDFDANSASVFFGQGLRWNTSFRILF